MSRHEIATNARLAAVPTAPRVTEPQENGGPMRVAFTSVARLPIVFRVIPRKFVMFSGAAALVVATAAPAWTAPKPASTATPLTAAAPAPTLAIDQVHAGQKAVVRTVFQGSKVEQFDAEIVGVLHNGRAEGDMILARATSERVIHTGIAQGMSGSPVYVDGKMIGALSSGWQFAKEPLFGITPIGEMLPLLDQPSVDLTGATAGPSGADVGGLSTGVRFGEFRWSDPPQASELAEPAGGARSATPALGLEPLGIPLACDGLSSAAFEFARQALAPLKLAPVPGGRAPDGGPPAASLEPGSAVAVDLLRGDLQFSAIGTATWVDHGRVLAFGHPFFQSGDVRLPLATAEIATIVPSEAISFKVGMRGATVGAIQQDRRSGIAGTLGPAPRMLPLAVTVRERPKPQSFRFETVEDRNLAPVLIAIASLNSVLESGGSGANQTLRWTLTLHRHGGSPLVMSDIATGDAPATDLATGILSPVRFLFANPYGALALDSVTVAVDVEPGRAQWTLRNARVLDGSVRPGGSVRVECELERWHGGRELRVITTQVPEELPDGRYVLWVGGGQELMHYEGQRLPGRYRPVSLEDAWNRLRQVRPSDALFASLFARAPEVTTEGRDYPELPASALPLLASGSSSGDRSRRGELDNVDEKRFPLGGQVHGEIVLPVDVDSQAP